MTLPYADRLGISVPFAWASEFNPHFEHDKRDGKDYVECYVWPANTKQQGYVYEKSLDWTKARTLKVDGTEYRLNVDYEIKHSAASTDTSLEYSSVMAMLRNRCILPRIFTITPAKRLAINGSSLTSFWTNTLSQSSTGGSNVIGKKIL